MEAETVPAFLPFYIRTANTMASNKSYRSVHLYGLHLKLYTSGKYTIRRKKTGKGVPIFPGRKLCRTLEKCGKKRTHDDIGRKEDTGTHWPDDR